MREVLAPYLGAHQVFMTAALIGKPGHKGGVRRYAAVRQDFIAALKADSDRFCTTMFDYCGLPTDWPDLSKAKSSDRESASSSSRRLFYKTWRRNSDHPSMRNDSSPTSSYTNSRRCSSAIPTSLLPYWDSRLSPQTFSPLSTNAATRRRSMMIRTRRHRNESSISLGNFKRRFTEPSHQVESDWNE